MHTYLSRLRQLSSAERGRILVSLTSGARRMVLARLRAQHPSASEQELKVRLAVRLYGKSIARRAFGEVPEDAG
jgi:hypothetical protein